MLASAVQRLFSALGFAKAAKSSFDPLRATTCDIQASYAAGTMTAVSVVEAYLAQIDRHEPYLKAIIELAPRAQLLETAKKLDIERKESGSRSPMHGIPVLVKDNIDIHPDLGVASTTGGSWALKGSTVKASAPAIERLVKAGAIILGKANMSELMWFKGNNVSGWSAVRGLTQSPYVRGGFQTNDTNTGHSNTAGSSSGSAVSVAAGFVPVSVGTDTGGSIAFPGCRQALYALRPSWNIIPGAGIIPITPRFDTIGPMTKSARDVAVMLDVMVDPSTTMIPEGGYVSCLLYDWEGLRVGSLEPEPWLLDDTVVKPVKSATEQEIRETKAAYKKLKAILGKNFYENVDLISIGNSSIDENGVDRFGSMMFADFRSSLNHYLEGLKSSKVRSLKELIEFNDAHPDLELPPGYTQQDKLLKAQDYNMSPEEYKKTDEWIRRKCGPEGIDKTLAQYDIDVIIGPADSLLSNLAASIGSPIGIVPLGTMDFNGRPFGLVVLAAAHNEAKILHFMSAWEKTMPPRAVPDLSKL
ncbi:amidase signature domain-containing protein [Bisporella sp. PMI_857]|nr:amidase signature domain-containing protein [Bisporella sp. PMI_857]